MKKLFAMILVILLAVTACVFTACDGESAAPDLTPTVEKDGDKPSGNVIIDKETDPDPSDPGEGESGGEEDPSGEGEGEGGSHQDEHVHSFYWVEGHDATCFETGEENHYACAECDKTFDLNYEECDDFTIPKREHEFNDPVTGYAATCYSDGMLDYKTCRLCGNTFDLEGNRLESTVIKAGHIYGDWIEAKEPNCTEEGVIGHYECQRCHEYFDTDYDRLYNVAVPVRHNLEWVGYRESTCTEDGWEGHYLCTLCGAWLNSNEQEIDPENYTYPASHSFGWESAREANCWEKGCIEHYRCYRCFKYFDTDYNYLGDDYSAVELPYNHLELSEWIAEKAVTCTEDGEVGHYYCSYCEYNLDAELNQIDDIVIKATGHEFEGATCQKCGKTLVLSTDLAVESNGDGTCKVVGVGSFTGSELVIPEKIGDDTVTKIAAAAFSNCTDLTLIYVPESVLEIGESAFAGCSSLETLIIPFVGASRTIEKERDTNKKYLGYMFSHDSFEGSYRVQESYSYVDYGSYTATYTRYIPTSLKDVVVMDGDIPYSFYGCRELRSVVLGAKVKSVGKSAFLGCLNMRSIKVGEGVTRIEDNAFNGCDSLVTLVLPSGLTYIGDVTFPYSLQIEYEGGRYFGNEENPYLVMTHGSNVIHEDTKFIGKDAFNPTRDWRLELIVSVELPAGLIGIGSNAFDYTKATLITLPSTLQYIGYQAFAHTRALSSIEIPVGTVIGERAFQGCTGLESAVIGGTLSGYMIFSGCENLSSVTVTAEGPETTIGSLAFSECAIESIVLPARVTGIGNSAFQKCASLVSVECLGDIQAIEYQAFYMCTALERINAAPRTIYGSAFSNCRSLKAFDFSHLVFVNDYAFLSCFSLESIEMPSTLSAIGDSVFAGCRSVTSITGVDNATFKYANNCIVQNGTIKAGCRNSTIPQDGSVTQIGAGAFANMGAISHLTIPASVDWVGDQAFYGCDLETITVAAGNTAFEIIDNCLIYKGTKTLILGSANTVIPTDAEIVTEIGRFAFGRNTKLTSITIPNNITSIGTGAFEYSGLRSISLPDSVTSLGSRAFQYCLDLEEVSLSGVKKINEQTFWNCPSLTVLHIGAAMTSIDNYAFYSGMGERVTPVNTIYIDCDMATYLTKYYHGTICFADAIYVDGELLSGEITIPDGVTSVAESAFDGRPITSVVIPVTVKQLKSNCFASCSELTSITFEGTRAEWDEISKSYGWISRSATCTVHCAMDGEEVVYN